MANPIKNQQDILAKFNIHALNPMQEEAISVIDTTANTILLSPTGTGKTLAFLLPLLKTLDPDNKEVQALILVPSRELAIQIEQVMRSMGSGYKVNAVYGGRSMSKDKLEIKHTPTVLIGTPGRVLDHLDRDRFATDSISTLILDEYDKSLEHGFEGEMKAIIHQLPNIKKRILTSATQGIDVPGFVRLNKPHIINYLQEKKKSKLSIKTVVSPTKFKLETLVNLLQHIGNEPGIIFCNLRDTIEQVSEFLDHHKIDHACFAGGMEQLDRESALIRFRNRSCQLLVATDLAARGIDVPEMKFIIHYEIPIHEEEFIHRNGRTARVNAKGTAFVLKWRKEELPDFINATEEVDISKKTTYKPPFWETLFISGGRRDKISKGDIAGLFFKQGNLNADQLGTIELKQDCAYVAIPKTLAHNLADRLNNSRLKKKKVRIRIAFP